MGQQHFRILYNLTFALLIFQLMYHGGDVYKKQKSLEKIIVNQQSHHPLFTSIYFYRHTDYSLVKTAKT